MIEFEKINIILEKLEKGILLTSEEREIFKTFPKSIINSRYGKHGVKNE
jgi:hypothetical protein